MVLSAWTKNGDWIGQTAKMVDCPLCNMKGSTVASAVVLGSMGLVQKNQGRTSHDRMNWLVDISKQWFHPFRLSCVGTLTLAEHGTEVQTGLGNSRSGLVLHGNDCNTLARFFLKDDTVAAHFPIGYHCALWIVGGTFASKFSFCCCSSCFHPCPSIAFASETSFCHCCFWLSLCSLTAVGPCMSFWHFVLCSYSSFLLQHALRRISAFAVVFFALLLFF